jgi:hypothetical protein
VLALGPSLVLAASVGYLLEQAIINGWSCLWVPPNVWLSAAGAVAALLSAVLWFAGHASGARRGAFIHAVAEDRLPRHVAEDAMLRAAVTATWPRAVVMPYRPVLLDRQRWQQASVDLSVTIREQVYSAVVANPGIRGVSLLPGGPSHVLALAGALAERALRDVGWPIRLIADDTSDVAKPFVEFELPRVPGRGGDDLDHAGGGPDGVLLLLREGETADEDSVRRALGEEVHIRSVTYEHPISETDEAYETVLDCFVQAVKELRSAGVARVYVQGQAPASLIFAAGFVASQASLCVASMPHEGEKGYGFASEPDPWAVHRPPPEAVRGRAHIDSHVSRAIAAASRLGVNWWGALIGYSLAMGILLPVVAGALALLLEWFLAKSQSGVVAADWGQLILALAAASVLLALSERLFSPRLNRPSVSIVAAPTAQTLARRVALIEPTTLSGEAAPLAEAITRQLGDIVAAVPGVNDVSVDLGTAEDCPNGRVAALDPKFGLRKSLRSTRPVRIRWSGKCTTAGPATSPPRVGALLADPHAQWDL